jgi:very-short-patch-repair endonuclease
MGGLRTRFAARARDLRQRRTEAERKIWERLRDRRLFGFKFVRQEQIGPFFADFACREANLVIELDGSQHAGSAYDERRTEVIEEHGYRVIRFWNSDALRNTDNVLQLIADQLATKSDVARFEGGEVQP